MTCRIVALGEDAAVVGLVAEPDHRKVAVTVHCELRIVLISARDCVDVYWAGGTQRVRNRLAQVIEALDDDLVAELTDAVGDPGDLKLAQAVGSYRGLPLDCA